MLHVFIESFVASSKQKPFALSQRSYHKSSNDTAKSSKTKLPGNSISFLSPSTSHFDLDGGKTSINEPFGSVIAMFFRVYEPFVSLFVNPLPPISPYHDLFSIFSTSVNDVIVFILRSFLAIDGNQSYDFQFESNDSEWGSIWHIFLEEDPHTTDMFEL